MGIYLNGTKPYLLFHRDRFSRYFVDKTRILKELVSVVTPMEDASEAAAGASGGNIRYLCITRPRRFGKTMMANMISSYFGKNIDSSAAFRGLNVSSFGWFQQHLNQHNVIHIMFNELSKNCSSYQQYIDRIEARLINDLIHAFPDIPIDQDDALWDALNNIAEYGGGVKFIFVLDE